MLGVDQMSTNAGVGVDGQPLVATRTDGQYLTDNSTSQYNMATVVAGQPNLRIDVPPPPQPDPNVPLLPTGVPSSPPATPPLPIPAPPGPAPTPPPMPSSNP
jgi:hypothetical protein